MSIPWNMIDEENISRSHREFLSYLNSLKPIYEGPEEFNFPSSSPLLLVIYNILYVLVLFFSFDFLFLISLFLLPISYLLGKELAKFTRIEIVILYFLISFFLFFINQYIGIISLISSFVILVSYRTSYKGKIYFAISVTASNLLSEFSFSNFPFNVLKVENSLNPYKLYLRINEKIENFPLNYQVYIYAINKGRVGIIVVVEYYLREARSKKFREVFSANFNQLKEILVTKLNQKEWILG